VTPWGLVGGTSVSEEHTVSIFRAELIPEGGVKTTIDIIVGYWANTRLNKMPHLKRLVRKIVRAGRIIL
jgi:hypothetical protein